MKTNIVLFLLIVISIFGSCKQTDLKGEDLLGIKYKTFVITAEMNPSDPALIGQTAVILEEQDKDSGTCYDSGGSYQVNCGCTSNPGKSATCYRRACNGCGPNEVCPDRCDTCTCP